MFSFIDDLPTPEQIKARVRDDIRKYGYDERWKNSRIVRKWTELYNDHDLKIDPATWIWKRLPPREAVRARVDAGTDLIWRFRTELGGLAAGALLVIVAGAVATSGVFGGASDTDNRPIPVYTYE